MENEIQPGLDGDFQQELDKLEACGNCVCCRKPAATGNGLRPVDGGC